MKSKLNETVGNTNPFLDDELDQDYVDGELHLCDLKELSSKYTAEDLARDEVVDDLVQDRKILSIHREELGSIPNKIVRYCIILSPVDSRAYDEVATPFDFVDPTVHSLNGSFDEPYSVDVDEKRGKQIIKMMRAKTRQEKIQSFFDRFFSLRKKKI